MGRGRREHFSFFPVYAEEEKKAISRPRLIFCWPKRLYSSLKKLSRWRENGIGDMITLYDLRFSNELYPYIKPIVRSKNKNHGSDKYGFSLFRRKKA